MAKKRKSKRAAPHAPDWSRCCLIGMDESTGRVVVVTVREALTQHTDNALRQAARDLIAHQEEKSCPPE